MNKSERDELRRLIRGRIKVLQADISTRRAELISELDQHLEGQYAAEMKRYDEGQFLIAEAVRAANRTANDVYREYFGKERWGEKADKQVVSAQQIEPPTREKSKERTTGVRAIEAKVLHARTELDRREQQLLEELTIGALESQDAKDFLARIPTVGELVPSSRLNEIAGE